MSRTCIDLILCKFYGAKHGGYGVVIMDINDTQFDISFEIIVNQQMRKYTKGEYTLGTISVVEF